MPRSNSSGLIAIVVIIFAILVGVSAYAIIIQSGKSSNNPPLPSPNSELIIVSGSLTPTYQFGLLEPKQYPTQIQFVFSSTAGINCNITQCLWTVSNTASAPPQYLTGSLDRNGIYLVKLPNNQQYSVTLAWVSQPTQSSPYGVIRATCTGTPLNLQTASGTFTFNINCTDQIKVFNP